jgi:ubiquinone/menaquinone biosynthesis C-methylase UbiE
MIHPHLVSHARILDEGRYVVVLRDSIDRAANLDYDETGSLAVPWLEESYRRMFRAKLSSARFSLPRGERVLDACCGFGYLGRMLAEDYGARVTFCDLSLAQLATLRQRLPAHLRRETAAADVTRLPFPDGTFDAFIGNSFLHHLSDVPAGMAEFRRVLKPGGTLMFLHEPSPTATYWESFPVSLVRDTTPTTGFTDLWAFTPADLLALAGAAGFRDARVVGTGLLSAVLLNWFLILGIKMGWESRALLGPAYNLRAALNHLEWRLPRALRPGTPPSLMLTAVKA